MQAIFISDAVSLELLAVREIMPVTAVSTAHSSEISTAWVILLRDASFSRGSAGIVLGSLDHLGILGVSGVSGISGVLGVLEILGILGKSGTLGILGKLGSLGEGISSSGAPWAAFRPMKEVPLPLGGGISGDVADSYRASLSTLCKYRRRWQRIHAVSLL